MASLSREDTWSTGSGENTGSSSGSSGPVQTTGECELQQSSTTDSSVPSVRGEPAPAITESVIHTSISEESSSTMSTTQESAISLRMLMGSKDVGGIIGKAGTTIKAFREQSGAKINISNGTSSERLVTVTGTKEQLSKAFLAIATKMQEDASSMTKTDTEVVGAILITIKLIIQMSQCGSLIGKGGSKIKEIRETTGASIQVAGESLPNSTERAVTVSGFPEAIKQCVEHICDVVLENPPKGLSIAYKPHVLPPNQAYQHRGSMTFPYTATYNTSAQPTTTIQHMRIPNDLIGCIIGRKGTKIHEIRVNSGAMIKIASNEGDGTDRLVTITGTPESVGIAQYLINSRIHSEVNSYLSIGLTTV